MDNSLDNTTASQSPFRWPPRGDKPQSAASSNQSEITQADIPGEESTLASGIVDAQDIAANIISKPQADRGSYFADIAAWNEVPSPRFPILHEAITLFEETWLGLVKPSLYDRATTAGWRPDLAGAYCPRCGISTGTHEALDPLDAAHPKDAGCASCRGEDLPWERFVRLGGYGGLLRDVILEVKFSQSRTLGLQIGRLLGAALVSTMLRCTITNAVVVPVPVHPLRRLLRGIDHTLTLARGAATYSDIRICTALSRLWRSPQARLSRALRRTNVKNSMSVRRDISAITKSYDTTVVVVLDDVRTTGATLTEACRVLRNALGSDSNPPQIWVCVLACAEPRSLPRAPLPTSDIPDAVQQELDD